MSKRCCVFTLLVLLAIWSDVAVYQVNAKRYMRCQLTRELIQKYKFSKTFLPNWICLVEHESDLDTTAVREQLNGNKNFGLFQISESDACRSGRVGGLCNKKCEDFLDDNISDDVQCAKQIYDNHGFKYWQGWKRSCRNTQNLPKLDIVCNTHVLSAYRSYKK